MTGWVWLTDALYTRRFLVRVVIKAALLFIVINIVYAVFNPTPLIGRISIYNTLVRGRERLPYGEQSAAYNLSLYSLDAMFSSHVVSALYPPDEYRVFLIGDSSVWGILLENDETIAGMLNTAALRVEGRPVRVYNLGYPLLSVTKDLLLLDFAMQYDPDMIVWLTTLDSMTWRDQLDPPLLQNNPGGMRDLIARNDLPLSPNDPRLNTPDFFGNTLIGQRRELADWLRLQLYGIAWQTTGIDQVYNEYIRPTNDFDTDETWGDQPHGDLAPSGLALKVIDAGRTLAGDVPLILVNEPIYIANGENSDLWFNLWYPRWAYDQYRTMLAAYADVNDIPYVEAWDLVPSENFTDSPVHVDSEGTRRLSNRLSTAIIGYTR